MAQQQQIGNVFYPQGLPLPPGQPLFPEGVPMPRPSLLTGMRTAEDVLEQQRQAGEMIEELQRQIARLENSQRDLVHDLEEATEEIQRRDGALSDKQQEMEELARSQEEGAATRLATLNESARKDKRQLIEEQNRCRELQEQLLAEEEQSRRLRDQLAKASASAPSSYAPARTRTRTSGRASSSSAAPINIEDIATEDQKQVELVKELGIIRGERKTRFNRIGCT
jgi:chromosome segregation ATPase